MINRFDRYVFLRMLKITLFVLAVLIFIFIIIDFSENSDDFTDQGATFAQIWGEYYLNYIPEMIRLVSPVAIFVACLWLTGQMADRFEIVALKAAGVSLYRLLLPYLAFAIVAAAVVSYLDGFIIPHSNAKRIAFERQYLKKKSEQIDRNRIYRQESSNALLRINYYDPKDSIAYKVNFYEFLGDSVKKTITALRMEWQPEQRVWRLINSTVRTYNANGYAEQEVASRDTTLNILPRDLARTTSDIYQLTYPEAESYINAIERIGASGASLPKIQFYGRLTYPLSIIVVVIIGFAIASVRRQGGKGFYIAAGLTISFLYLAFMKLIEPFGSAGEVNPVVAATLPHAFFFLVGLFMVFSARK